MNSFNLTYDRTRYPAGIQVFEQIRKGDMVYVDKTAYVYELTRKPFSYFLSRPRRFGKSLLLSTIEAYFQGRRELFEGLAIESLEKEWAVHPVIHIDLSQGVFATVEDAQTQLYNQINLNAYRLGIALEYPDEIGRFQELILKASQRYGTYVVVLVDEYDKPLLETMQESEELQQSMHALMRGFYGCVKGSSAYLRFVMITGVSKFNHVNIFSGLNNLVDLSLDPWCNAICGISESEMQQYFREDIQQFATLNSITSQEAIELFRLHYDGYRFAKIGENIYNPFSVVRAFTSMEFGNYWFSTGTPNHLIKALAGSHFDFDRLEGIKASASELMEIPPTIDGNPIGLLYQSGYLTIKEYDDAVFTLGFPNREVSSGFYNALLSIIFPDGKGMGFSAGAVRNAAKSGEPHKIVQLLEMGLNDYTYDQTKDLSTEAVFNSLLYGLCKAIGLDTKAEYHTANGRIDMTIETQRYIYIFEFKINSTPQIAINQIIERDYANKYLADHRILYKIGVNFDTSKRTLSGHLVYDRHNNPIL